MNMNSNDQPDVTAPVQEVVTFDVRHLSEQQLAALGVSHIAYVKPVMVNGIQGFAIHAADGTPMAVAGVGSLKLVRPGGACHPIRRQAFAFSRSRISPNRTSDCDGPAGAASFLTISFDNPLTIQKIAKLTIRN